MHQKSTAMIKVLLNRYHEGEAERLIECLPDDIKTAVSQIDLSSNESEQALFNPMNAINNMHYSWLVDTFDEFPKTLTNSFLAALPESHRQGISEILGIKYTPIDIGDRTKKYLLYLMAKKVYQRDILPIAFLPKTALSPMLDMSKQELVLLVDLLGVHDLAEKIRHIVDKNKLTLIYKCLNQNSLKYLSQCLHRIEKIAISDLDLSRWDGDEKKLNKLLHQKGLERLAKALSGSHSDFIWHLCHRFDKGRGLLLEKNIKPNQIPTITPLLAEQVLNIINLMHSKEQK